MADIFELTVEPRTLQGKGASRRLRRMENRLPAIIYGGDKEPINIMIEQRFAVKALENEAFYSHVLTLNDGQTTHKVVLKDVQRHPYKAIIMHMDFMRVDDKTAITMQVPLHFLGEDVAPGVKKGGIVSHHVTELEVRCLPKNLPEFLEVDLSNADMDHIVHLKDISLPNGVELMSLVQHPDQNHPVASIHKPRVSEESSDTADSEAGDSK